MLRAIIGFTSIVGKAHAEFAKSMEGNPLQAWANRLELSRSGVGWVLLVGEHWP